MSDTPVNVKTCQNSGPGATRECSPRRSSLFQGFRVGAELLGGVLPTCTHLKYLLPEFEHRLWWA